MSRLVKTSWPQHSYNSCLLINQEFNIFADKNEVLCFTALIPTKMDLPEHNSLNFQVC